MRHIALRAVTGYTSAMNKIAIPKTEYRQLRRQADAYKKIAGDLSALILRDSVAEAVGDFRNTGLYAEEFLSDMETGLRKSSYQRGK